ncbi:hypothetical protein BC835DRAFT_1304542 [Cytidiella melzeri]|nr:hypothetical protein BC835DRAFT_1304542 [Cytidiella melzeri]
MDVYSRQMLAPKAHDLKSRVPDVQMLEHQVTPQILSPQSSVAASTPSLVARSLTSSPSTSTSPEESYDVYATDGRVVESRGLGDLDSSAFSFTTEDWNDPLFTGRTLLPCPRDSPPHCDSQYQAADFVPNPHALPYLPTSIRKRSRTNLDNCGKQLPSWRPHHAWLRPLRAGGVARHSATRRGYAKDLVSAGPWDTSLISELAARFIDRAAEGLSDDIRCVAPFAREVFEAFRQQHEDSLAEIFAQQLRQCLLSEFRAWWLQGLPSSIYNLPQCSPCPSHELARRHLSSALAVAEFTGDLYACSLVAGHYLLLCINMILDRLTILEEVYALHTIVHHAGEAMYSRLQMIDFVIKLQRRAQRIGSGASVLGHTNVVAEVARLVEDLTSLVNGWAKARATPAPSECSDLASEYSDHNPDMAQYHELTVAPTSPSVRHVAAVSSSPTPTIPPGLRHPSEAAEYSSQEDRSVNQTIYATPSV